MKEKNQKKSKSKKKGGKKKKNSRPEDAAGCPNAVFVVGAGVDAPNEKVVCGF